MRLKKLPPTLYGQIIGLPTMPSPSTIAPKVSTAMMIAPTLWMTLWVRWRSHSRPIVIASPTFTCSAISLRPLDMRNMLPPVM